ncbi:MAG: hypothetical protein PHY12_05560 [Eubacteriales bacterium]|nr:hypothetical protein [Eubacteriales bacterium]
MQLLEWQAMHILGEWRESLLYFCLFLSNVCFLLPLLRDSSWKKGYLVPAFAAAGILLPTLWSSFSYRYLAVDFTMGALLGMALVQAFRGRNGDSFAPLAFGAALCALVLTKTVGVAWAVVGMAFWWIARDQRAPKRPWILAAAAALACFLSWKIFCQANGLDNYLSDDTKKLLEAVFAGTYQRPSGTAHTTVDSLKAFVLFPTNWDQDHKALLGLPFVVWTLMYAAIPYVRRDSLAQPDERLPRRISAMILCVSLLSLLIYIASYFVTFADEMLRYSGQYENVAIQLERYCLPFIVGFGCLSLEMAHALPRKPVKGDRRVAFAKWGAVVLAALMMVNWQMIGFYLQPTPERTDWIEYEREHTDWFQRMSEEDRKETRILFAYSKIINYTAYALVPATFTGLTAEALKRADNVECVREWVDSQRATHVIFYDDQNDSYAYLCKAFDIQAPELNQLYRIDKSEKPYRLRLETDDEAASAESKPRKETSP